MFSAVRKRKTSISAPTENSNLTGVSFKAAIHEVSRNFSQSTEKARQLLSDQSFHHTAHLYQELITKLEEVQREINQLTASISTKNDKSFQQSQVFGQPRTKQKSFHRSRQEPVAIQVAKRLLARGEKPSIVARKVMLPENTIESLQKKEFAARTCESRAYGNKDLVSKIIEERIPTERCAILTHSVEILSEGDSQPPIAFREREPLPSPAMAMIDNSAPEIIREQLLL